VKKYNINDIKVSVNGIECVPMIIKFKRSCPLLDDLPILLEGLKYPTIDYVGFVKDLIKEQTYEESNQSLCRTCDRGTPFYCDAPSCNVFYECEPQTGKGNDYFIPIIL
jgi:hypothetical protein